MNKNIHYCFLVLTLLICGCVGSKKDAEVDIDFTYTISTNDTIVDKFNYDELIDSIFIVRLETNKSCLLNAIDKVIFHENTCFVLDKAMGVYAFSMSGAFIQKVGAIGRGPGEYLRCSDISVSDSLLCVYNSAGFKIDCYSTNNYNYIGSYAYPHGGPEAIVNGDYIFGRVLEENSLKSIPIKYKKDDEITLFDFRDGKFNLPTGNKILTSNNKHFWVDPLRCEVYELSGDGRATPYWKLDETELIVTEEELMNITESTKITKQGKITFFQDYYETSKYQKVRYSKDGTMWGVLRNVNSNKLYHFDMLDMGLRFYQPFYNIDGVYNDYFVSIDNDLPSLLWMYNDYLKDNGAFTGIYSGLNELKNVKEDDNPILFFARFK